MGSICAPGPVRPWFAARVRTRYEKRTSDLLTGKGFRTFLPQYRTKKIWSDRIVMAEMPLFPGYLFLQMDPLERWLPVISTPGVISLVCTDGAPAEVERREVESLMQVAKNGVVAEPFPFIESGQRVVVEQGPLAGMDGIFMHVKNRERLIISVTLLQRSVSVEIERCWVRPLSTFRKSVDGAAHATLAKAV